MALGQQAMALQILSTRIARTLVAALFVVGLATGAASAQQVASLTPDLLSNYVASSIDAKLGTDITFQPTEWLEPQAPTVSSEMLSAYAATKFVPTAARVKQARNERDCLAQALYHEARGEPETGQWAVANVILNRVVSKRYPSTICGVVFQNAGGKKFRCQFSFACDGRSDSGGNGNRIVRESWVRANLIAHAAFKRFQAGHRPDAVPGSALFYHTKAVSPSWSSAYRVVAQIGSHIFYSPS